MVKFIHAGDVHLGNAFIGLRDIPDWLIEKLQRATLDAFRHLIDMALNEDVDLVLLPGDVYNTNELNPRIQLFLMEQLERLNEKNIPVVLSYGNHDFVKSVEYAPLFSKNVHILGPQVETLTFTTKQNEQIAISGFSYNSRHINENMTDDFPIKQQAEDYHIGMYHGALGTSGIGDYAPFNVSDLNTKHYQYWALGHIHVRQTLQENPFIGYSGSLQGLNHKESGNKGFYLVESDENHNLHPKFETSSPIIWQTITLNIENDQEIKASDLIDLVKSKFESHDHIFLLIRLNLIINDQQQLQILKSNAFYQQLKNQFQDADKMYIYQLEIELEQLGMAMPSLPVKPNPTELDRLVNVENLNEMGLNLVDNSAVFELLTASENLAEIKNKIQMKLKTIQGGVQDVD